MEAAINTLLTRWKTKVQHFTQKHNTHEHTVEHDIQIVIMGDIKEIQQTTFTGLLTYSGTSI